MQTYHKAIVLQDITLHHSPVFLKQNSHIISLSVPTKVADENFDGHVPVQKTCTRYIYVAMTFYNNDMTELGGWQKCGEFTTGWVCFKDFANACLKVLTDLSLIMF